MNKKSLSVLLSFLLIWVLFTAPAWAGQVVTDEVKAWAKGAIEQEKALKTVSAPNTVAVLYFSNKTGWLDLDILQKGLTLMLITDLSKVPEIQVVERVRVQALIEELGLEVSGLVKPTASSQMGKLLGVELLVGGDILRGKIEELFQLKSNLLKVRTEKVVGQPWAEGELLAELFRMEKDLLFDIIKQLKIELSPALEAELKQPLTTNLNALLYLFEGIDYSDRGDYSKAAESYKKALGKDLNLGQAEDCLLELQALNLWEGAIEAYSEPERGGIAEPVAYERLDDRDLTEREDNSDEIDIDIDQYTRGDPPPIVDGGSLVEARSDIVTNDKLRASVVNGDFVPGDLNQAEPSAENQLWRYEWSGPYESGLQTIGIDEFGNPKVFLNPEAIERINDDPFLAYAVQVEEDRLNQEILEMHRKAAAGELLDTINWQLASGDIRTRDDFLMQQADAQAGRVLKDVHGNWVRVQQYVLRPDAKTVQVLNVCLRESGAGNLAGLSTIDWTTKFTGPYYDDLRLLPSHDWLNTMGEYPYRYVFTTDNAPELGSMYVKFTNPGGESLQEQRWFDPKDTGGNWQRINGEQLTLISLTGGSETKTETYGYDFNGYPVGNGYYDVEQEVGGPGSFDYVFPSFPSYAAPSVQQRINVSCYIVGDIDTVDGEESPGGIYDIWDALRVNMSEWPYIGNNNLEISIDNGTGTNIFSRPIDVVYIPMSRMLWKDL